jgi:hypothetical protein
VTPPVPSAPRQSKKIVWATLRGSWSVLRVDRCLVDTNIQIPYAQRDDSETGRCSLGDWWPILVYPVVNVRIPYIFLILEPAGVRSNVTVL